MGAVYLYQAGQHAATRDIDIGQAETGARRLGEVKVYHCRLTIQQLGNRCGVGAVVQTQCDFRCIVVDGDGQCIVRIRTIGIGITSNISKGAGGNLDAGSCARACYKCGGAGQSRTGQTTGQPCTTGNGGVG